MTSTVRAGLIGAGIGGASMFLLDPDRGGRRRALVRDKAVSAARKTRDAASATGRDLGNRVGGLQSRVRARLSDEAVSDGTMRERVRAALGRVASHPRAISVAVADGWATLSGDALDAEVAAIVRCVERVRGVKGVQNELRAHAAADGIPALQGKAERAGWWSRWIHEGWSPTALLVAGVATGALAVTAAAVARHGHGSSNDTEGLFGTARPHDDRDGEADVVTDVDILAIDTVPSDVNLFGDSDGLL
jgi:gas vesicle protein